ncbi:unnamed protein product [Blepharisma stoltei]|uniref:Uncharacterized protein n=1 Tax=Blepharisma stoltei TaxID=1481888 RepID=A0AAU9IKP8_9CILI|nr:unnamed protein product [Blepharisma stoltei]
MKGRTTAVSQDFPENLISPFILRLKRPETRPSKQFNPELKLGVSSESPVSFHLSNVPVLTREMKIQYTDRKSTSPDRFIPTQKQYKIIDKRKFTYQNYLFHGKCDPDKDSISPSKSLDLDYAEMPQKTSGYNRYWKRRYDSPEGFKKYQGMFSWNINHKKNNYRFEINHIKNLKEKIQLSSRRTSRVNTPEKPARPISCDVTFRRYHKERACKSSRESIDITLQINSELESFEKRIETLKPNTRKIYEI